MPNCVLTDGKEDGLSALLCQCAQYGWRIDRPRTVVEGEHYFPITQEIVRFKVLESETRASSAIDFNNPRDTKEIGIAAACFGIHLLRDRSCRSGG